MMEFRALGCSVRGVFFFIVLTTPDVTAKVASFC